MKNLLWIGLLAAAALVPARADAWDYPPWRVKGGANVYLKVQVGNANLPLAPWYLYFPYDPCLTAVPPVAHYPNWQAPPNGLPAAAYGYPQPMTPLPTGPLPGQGAPPGGIQRTGYQPVSYPAPQTPAYWYGR